METSPTRKELKRKRELYRTAANELAGKQGRESEFDFATSQVRDITDTLKGSYFPKVQVREPDIYGKDSPYDIVLDTIATKTNIISPCLPNLDDARRRLESYNRYDVPKQDRKAIKNVERRFEEHGVKVVRDGAPMNVRALSSISGFGGEFNPPVFMLSAWADSYKAASVAATLIPTLPVPDYGDYLYIPSVSQSYDPVAVDELTNPIQGITATNTYAATNMQYGIRRYSSVTPVSLQLLDRSPNISQVLAVDASRSLAEVIDYDIAAGNGVSGTQLTAGQISGYVNQAANGITYTDSSPTPIKLIENIGIGAETVACARKRPAQVLFLTPQRIAQLAFSNDSEGDPLQRVGIGTGTLKHSTDVQTYIGGLPTYQLAGLQDAVTAGHDCALLARPDEDLLFLGQPQFSFFEETCANTLTVLFLVSQYVCFAARYPYGDCVVSGTGWSTTSL